MKNIFKLVIISLFIFTGCTDKDTLSVDFDELIESGGPFATDIASQGVINVDKLVPETSEFSKTFQLVSPKGGTDITKLEVYASFTGVNVSADEVLFSTITSESFIQGDDYPEATVVVNGGALLSALNVNSSELEGDDVFKFRLALTTPEGTFTDVSSNFDNQSADHKFSASVICVSVPEPGDWILAMQDSYGDGWDGAKVVVNIDGNSTIYTFTSGFDETFTITIPEGTSVFTFTYEAGNWEEEHTYTLTDPNGVVVLDEGPNPTTGELLNKCE